MNFVNPLFLIALTSIAIPVIIHLFYFRKFKKLNFSNTQMLKAINEERQSKQNLKHLLILLSRILAIAALVFAFSQPYIPFHDKNLKPGRNILSIYIDNSPSMENQNKSGILLDQAKNISKEIIRKYSEDDAYQIITNDVNQNQLKLISKEAALARIDEIKISSQSKTASAIFERQKTAFSESGYSNKIAYLISDFQKSFFDKEKINPDSTAFGYFVPLKATTINNLSIDSAWFESPVLQSGKQINLMVTLKNYGDNDIKEQAVNLKVNNKVKAISTFSVNHGEKTNIVIPFTLTDPGWNKASISITDFPVTFDDQYYFSFYVAEKLNILCIYGNKASVELKAVFASEKYFDYTENTENEINKLQLENFDLIILNELNDIPLSLAAEIRNLTSKGKNIILIPSSLNLKNSQYTHFFRQFALPEFQAPLQKDLTISAIDIKIPFFRGIFERYAGSETMPFVRKYYPRNRSVFSAEKILLKLSNGENFLTSYHLGKGNVYIFHAPVHNEWTNIGKSWLFLPLIYQMSFFTNQSEPISYTFGFDKSYRQKVPSEISGSVFKILNEEREFIPPQKFSEGYLNVNVTDEFSKAGFYQLYESRKSFNTIQYPVAAFNISRKESDLEPFSFAESEKWLKDNHVGLLTNIDKTIVATNAPLESGRPLWKLFILLTLLFILSEILIIRFLKN